MKPSAQTNDPRAGLSQIRMMRFPRSRTQRIPCLRTTIISQCGILSAHECAEPGMPLTDKLRAAVFARDKGICAFSNLSVWMLDYGTAPFGHPDWADHIKP